jgi:hypothetical protein
MYYTALRLNSAKCLALLLSRCPSFNIKSSVFRRQYSSTVSTGRAPFVLWFTIDAFILNLLTFVIFKHLSIGLRAQQSMTA